jgi:hypothetical protein
LAEAFLNRSPSAATNRHTRLDAEYQKATENHVMKPRHTFSLNVLRATGLAVVATVALSAASHAGNAGASLGDCYNHVISACNATNHPVSCSEAGMDACDGLHSSNARVGVLHQIRILQRTTRDGSARYRVEILADDPIPVPPPQTSSILFAPETGVSRPRPVPPRHDGEGATRGGSEEVSRSVAGQGAISR